MATPIIGVTPLWDDKLQSVWMLSEYMDAIRAAGGIPVNTLHHQAVKDLAPGLEVMAVASDGLIEAAWMRGKRFVWGVQWHPEYMFKADTNSLKLFEAFINAYK